MIQAKAAMISGDVIGMVIRRSAIVLAAWLPLYVVWALSAVSFG